MGFGDYTEIGGTGGEFMTTHWSLVERAASPETDQDREFIGLLLKRYWKPVYCYLRRKGYDNDRAKDLTQGFFHEVVLERHLIEKVDAAKGRFRSFLLIALDRYMVNVYESDSAQKRSPRGKLVSLEFDDLLELPSTVSAAASEQSFNYVWFTEMLEGVLDRVEQGCHGDGQSVHWQLFQDRVLQPILEGTSPPSVEELCSRHEISDGAKLSKMIYTVKRRLRSTLQKMIRETVVSDDSIEAEWEEIKRFFPDFA